jgi:hypothetical protein
MPPPQFLRRVPLETAKSVLERCLAPAFAPLLGRKMRRSELQLRRETAGRPVSLPHLRLSAATLVLSSETEKIEFLLKSFAGYFLSTYFL